MRKSLKLLTAAALCWPVVSWSAHGFNSIYTAELRALNNSGVSGNAVLAFSGGNTLRVIIQADSLTPDQAHAQHIHGFADADMPASCPNLDADTDGDNLVSVPEGAPFYGDIQLSLDGDDGSAPTVGADGSLAYAQTFTLGENGLPDLAALGNPGNRVIVLHGLAFNNGSYVATQPVACGTIKLAVLQTPPEVVEPQPTAPPSNGGGGGSSGSLGLWSLGLLLLGWRPLRRRR